MLGEDVAASIAPAEAVVPVTPTPAEEDQLTLSSSQLDYTRRARWPFRTFCVECPRIDV